MPSPVPTASADNPDTGEKRAAADPDVPISLAVEVVHSAGEWGDIAEAIGAVEAAAAALAADVEATHVYACVALSCDAEVERLNATYRGKPAPTNVLSFGFASNAPPEPGEPRFLGDVVLAAETIAREAVALGIPLRHHLQHLVVHGLLHLQGFDHTTDDQARQMEALEIKVLARLGIANPYQAADAPSSPRRHQTETIQS